MFRQFASEFSADFAESGIYVIRMVIAAICGAAVGIERGKRHKDAGIRTHIIVAMGAALMMVISKYGFFDVIINDSVNVDASRIAANVVTGISFLGAGVIFVRDISIKGLTTAAGIWATSAIGMAIGAGQYTIGIFATVLMVLVQFVLHKFFSGLESTVNEFTAVLVDNPDSVANFRKLLSEHKISITSCRFDRNEENKTIKLDIVVTISRSTSLSEALTAAGEDPDVISVEMIK